MKTKFQNFNLGEVEVLTQAEQSRVKGGYPPNSSNWSGGFGGNHTYACIAQLSNGTVSYPYNVDAPNCTEARNACWSASPGPGLTIVGIKPPVQLGPNGGRC